ncbi:cell wall-binding repeat-containing protein [Romboutsia sedimentorum]|uniref:Cell wall-binding repeat-containing protein n=1 Tax=Romboutsia sedimentorum TaxID=1368474 RepID=A0ABT7E9T8_9FIRM|nr:cell wall-binding repeat-containing protein [Romboutsia sedimentorum]MDK2563682.1 cell wall-binding repeat-containing protein [Romboutsia sedimentorum]
MKKNNKNMWIILSVALIVANPQITRLSHALEVNANQATLEKNIEEHVPQISEDTKSEEVVTNKTELISALKNENIKIIDIKNDIDLPESTIMYIKGNGKEIRGNGNEIRTVKNPESDFVESSRIYVETDTKIDNLKLDEIQIRVESYEISLDIVNNSEINNGGILFWGDVTLENVKVNNGSIYGYGNIVVDSNKMKNATITYIGKKDKTLKIINTEMNGKWYSDAPICSESGNIELENVKIINPGDHAIYTMGSKHLGTSIRIKGTLEIDGAKKDAIVLSREYDYDPNNPPEVNKNTLELHIDGDIKQKGDTYTIKAEKGIYTNVYYNESKIKKVIDKWSYVYYSTKNREGNEPQSIVHTNKLIGEDRYQTAIKISKERSGEANYEGWRGARNVIVVNSNSMVDALSAAPFAWNKSAPILLTEKNKLNSETKKEISRLRPDDIYVIGGENSVSDAVINELKDMGINVERISGNDRYETSLEIAKKLGRVSEIAVVNGVKGIPDAVSIAPVAADKNMPIVLASPNEGTKVFDQYIKENYITKSYIIGKEAAISNEIANKLPNPERLGGIDRNDTNAVILEKFYTDEKLNNIFIVKDGMKKQDDLIDALAVSTLTFYGTSPVVIVGNDLSNKQESLLSKKHPMEITQVGGNGNENVFNKLVNMFKN